MTRFRPGLVLGTISLVSAGCGSTAPRASVWPLLPGASVLGSAQTESAVDDSDHAKFREIVIAGAAGRSAAELRDASVRFARRHGWHEADAARGRSGADANPATSFSYVERADRGVWASVAVLTSADIELQPDGLRRVIISTLRARTPALLVTLRRD